MQKNLFSLCQYFIIVIYIDYSLNVYCDYHLKKRVIEVSGKGENKFMAKPIEATPTLYGQDAQKVISEVLSKTKVADSKKNLYKQSTALIKKLNFRG